MSCPQSVPALYWAHPPSPHLPAPSGNRPLRMELPLTLTVSLPHRQSQGEAADDGVRVPKLYHLSHSCMVDLCDAEAPTSKQTPDIPSTKDCACSDPQRPRLPVSQTRPRGTCPEDPTPAGRQGPRSLSLPQPLTSWSPSWCQEPQTQKGKSVRQGSQGCRSFSSQLSSAET